MTRSFTTQPAITRPSERGALEDNTTGNFNTAFGVSALLSNTTGEGNTANGYSALLGNSTGNNNTALGVFALESNSTSGNNTAIGWSALRNNTTAGSNTAVGQQALTLHATGDSNNAFGASALANDQNGTVNSGFGDLTLFNNVTGFGNTAMGASAGYNIDGNWNTCIGAAVYGNSGDNNTIHIGDSAYTPATAQACFIAGIFNNTSAGGAGVFINSTGQLGTLTSSRRFKEEIKPMGKASEALLALKPVTFHYKKEIDRTGISQFGLVAEEVEKVNPDLVVRDKEGKAYSVRYDQVNAMLLNEFLKEHRKVGEQKATIVQLKKRMEMLAAHVKEQDSKIQKVSARIEMSRPASQVAATNP